MNINVMHHHVITVSLDQATKDQIGRIEAYLVALTTKGNEIMATLQDVQAAVAAEDTVIDSAIALLQGLAAQIAALAPNQTAIDALAADVTAKTTALANAVVANTPPAPTPTGATGPT